jgi:hypothetical protein
MAVKTIFQTSPRERAEARERGGLFAQSVEIIFMEAHAVELPAEAPPHLRITRLRGLALVGGLRKRRIDLIGVLDVALVELEMVLQELVAEARRPQERLVVFRMVLGGVHGHLQ